MTSHLPGLFLLHPKDHPRCIRSPSGAMRATLESSGGQLSFLRCLLRSRRGRVPGWLPPWATLPGLPLPHPRTAEQSPGTLCKGWLPLAPPAESTREVFGRGTGQTRAGQRRASRRGRAEATERAGGRAGLRRAGPGRRRGHGREVEPAVLAAPRLPGTGRARQWEPSAAGSRPPPARSVPGSRRRGSLLQPPAGKGPGLLLGDPCALQPFLGEP